MLDLLVDDYVNNMILGYENNLRIILTDEDVEVTEDNDMNSLIVKVDDEFDRKNEEITKLNNNLNIHIIGKQDMVNMLIEKGADDLSVDSTWDEIIQAINSSNINLAPLPPIANEPSYSIGQITDADYGFELSDDGYYESQNKGVDDSYALCVLELDTLDGEYTAYLDCINYAEKGYDYGLISTLNNQLSRSNEADESNVLKSFIESDSGVVQSVRLGSKSGFYHIKFIKDVSGSENNDSLKFKVRWELTPDGPIYDVNQEGEDLYFVNDTGTYSSTSKGDRKTVVDVVLTEGIYRVSFDLWCKDSGWYSNGYVYLTPQSTGKQETFDYVNHKGNTESTYSWDVTITEPTNLEIELCGDTANELNATGYMSNVKVWTRVVE